MPRLLLIVLILAAVISAGCTEYPVSSGEPGIQSRPDVNPGGDVDVQFRADAGAYIGSTGTLQNEIKNASKMNDWKKLDSLSRQLKYESDRAYGLFLGYGVSPALGDVQDKLLRSIATTSQEAATLQDAVSASDAGRAADAEFYREKALGLSDRSEEYLLPVKQELGIIRVQ
jgi:hypothetical protein